VLFDLNKRQQSIVCPQCQITRFTQPLWRDADTVAFSVEENNRDGLWIYARDTGKARRAEAEDKISNLDTRWRRPDPGAQKSNAAVPEGAQILAVSPKGESAAFVSQNEGRSTSLFLTDPRGAVEVARANPQWDGIPMGRVVPIKHRGISGEA